MNFKDKNVQFFFKHAGFSYDPKTETKTQGRIRCARSLAHAEQTARELDWRFEWSDDWSLGCSHKEFYGADSAYAEREPETCESCLLFDGDRVLASLSCIDDADDNYRRVIQAELALEALHTRNTKLEREANTAGDVPDVPWNGINFRL